MHRLPALSAPVIRRLSPAVLLAAGMFLFSFETVFADDTASQIPGGVTLQAVGSETGSWESNPLMQFGKTKSLYGSITTPELIVNDKTPTSLLSVDALLNENIFNQSSFDSTDFHDKLGFNTQTQRWGAGFQEQTDYDTTRTSELFPTGLNGVIFNKAVRHFGISGAPQVSFSPNATNKFALAGSAAFVTYDNPVFANYDLFSVTPSYTHNFDPLNAGVFSLQAQRYQTTNGPPVFDDSIGPSIGWIGTLTPRLSAKATVGFQESRQFGSGAVQASWSPQYTFATDIGFKGQQDTTHFLASRNNYPFGNGTESLLTSFSLTEIHDLNQRFALNAGATYQSATYQSTAVGNLDYQVIGNGGLTYHATDRLDVAATYQYRRETLVGTPGNAQDNMVTFGLIYRPRPWNL